MSFDFAAGDVIAPLSLLNRRNSLANEINASHIRAMTQKGDVRPVARLGLSKEAKMKHYGLEARHRERTESSRAVALSVLGRPSTQRGGQKRPRARYDRRVALERKLPSP
jgi:hypothetical protein